MLTTMVDALMAPATMVMNIGMTTRIFGTTIRAGTIKTITIKTIRIRTIAMTASTIRTLTISNGESLA